MRVICPSKEEEDSELRGTLDPGQQLLVRRHLRSLWVVPSLTSVLGVGRMTAYFFSKAQSPPED